MSNTDGFCKNVAQSLHKASRSFSDALCNFLFILNGLLGAQTLKPAFAPICTKRTKPREANCTDLHTRPGLGTTYHNWRLGRRQVRSPTTPAGPA